MKKIIYLIFFHTLIVLLLVFLSFIHYNNKKVPKNVITINYKDMNSDILQKINLEDYIIGVVAAEMPASFEMEALKAQAVAVRTYSIRNKDMLTNDINTSQAYNTIEDMKKKWGEGFKKNYKKIKEAVYATEGEVIQYNGEIISAVYHSTSAGVTQNSKDVWNETPYLISVESPYDKDAPGYYSEYKISEEKLAKILNINGKVVISNIERYESGYVKTITVNKKQYTGAQFRKLLDLRSNNFEIEKIGNDFIISIKGYGHGVGMSQYGANFLAKEGKNYKDILKHYYTGVEICMIDSQTVR